MQISGRAVRTLLTRRHLTHATRAALRLVACGTLMTHAPTFDGFRAPKSVFIANVADASTNAPVTDAVVEVSDVGRTARTDWIGEAHVVDVARGRHHVTVRHIGYVPADVEIIFTRDTVGYVFLLSPSPTMLDTVRTTAKVATVPLKLQDFEMRRRTGIGRFLTDSALQKEATRPIADIMARHFPGIYSFSQDQTVFRRNCNTWGLGPPADGEPDVYIDGVRYNRARPLSGSGKPIPSALDLRSIDGIDVAGVEYYTATSAPAQYRRPGMICGVILIWLKY